MSRFNVDLFRRRPMVNAARFEYCRIAREFLHECRKLLT